MDRLLIEWGKLDRSEALEKAVKDRAEKILRIYPDCTNLIVGFQTTNPISSKGLSSHKVSLEVRLPKGLDVRATKEGNNLYSLISEAEKALYSQKR